MKIQVLAALSDTSCTDVFFQVSDVPAVFTMKTTLTHNLRAGIPFVSAVMTVCTSSITLTGVSAVL